MPPTIHRVVTRIGQLDVTGSPSDGQVLTWDDATSRWVPETPTAASAAIGGAVGGTPATNQILYVNGSGNLAQGGPAVVSGVLSSPGAGTDSQAFGAGAVAAGTDSIAVAGSVAGSRSIAIGRGAASGSATNDSVSIGQNVSMAADCSQSVAIGQNASTSQYGGSAVVIGALARSSTNSTVAVGYSSVCGGVGSSAIGRAAYNVVANSVVFGAQSVSLGGGVPFHAAAYVNKMVIGRGHVDPSPVAAVAYTTTGGVGTDIGGSDVILAGGISTGLGSTVNARGGAVRLQTAPRALATGSTAGTLVDRVVVAPDKTLANNTNHAVATVALPAGGRAGLTLKWSVESTDGTDFQVSSGLTTLSMVNKAGTLTKTVSGASAASSALSSGTLGVFFDVGLASNVATITCNANSSLTPSTGYPRLHLVLENNSTQAVALV